MFRWSYLTILCNNIFKGISISIIINQSVILELCNSLTLLNPMEYPRIPSLVSDGMSKFNSIISYHSPMSLCLYTGKIHRSLIEKEDLINQSSPSFILFIINSFDSVVYWSQANVQFPRVMDSSRIWSHSSFIQLFILSNTIQWR